MHRKPLIGFNTDFRSAQKNVPALSLIFAGYYDSILKQGGLPVILPPLEEAKDIEQDLEQYLDILDGFVLIGGADLDPRRDGYMLHPSVRLLDERREIFDRYLVDKIAQRRMPLLAIGTGMQILNVSQGGTLFLHIPEDLPRALPHRDAMDPLHRHAIVIEKGSFMEDVYGDNDVRVNSSHHMSVDDVAQGFLATARCPDGVIESIESVHSDWLAVGVQFHPESPTATAMDSRIFQLFMEQLRLRSGHHFYAKKAEPAFA